jgi:hypothetical protein
MKIIQVTITGPDAEKMDMTTMSEILYRGTEVYGLDLQYEVADKTPPPLPDPPVPFVFGFMKIQGKTYVGIAAKPFWEANKHLDDSSSVHSAQSYVNADDEEDAEWLVDEWLTKATQGVLAGEAMESMWEAMVPDHEVKAQLEANGLEFVDMSEWDE